MTTAKTSVSAVSVIQRYIEYRKHQVNQEIEDRKTQPFSGGSAIAAGERNKVLSVLFDELEVLSSWLEAGEPVYVKPLTEAEKKQWRFAIEVGADVPEHVKAQL